MRISSLFPVGGGLLVLSLLAWAPQDPAKHGVQNPEGGKYIGSAACKNCHNGQDKGNAFDHWLQTPHAKAYETLATPAAKEVAKKLGIEGDPQKSEKCLQCHVTAYGAPANDLKNSFKVELGVQCESCHGPGEAHQKKRMREAMKKGAEPSPVTADEVVIGRSAETCKTCHNDKSPTYKPFCLVERMKTIEHLDPRKARSKEQLEQLRATCEPGCKTCEEAKKKAGDGK